MASIAINGLGRVGRAALKILEQADGAEVVAVNDLVPPDNLAYLLRYDTAYGRWHTTVTADGDALAVGGRKIPVLARRDPAELPWRDLGVDLVLECTGAFRREGKFDGVAIRVPIPVGSIADVTAVTARPVTREEVNHAFREEAASDRYRGILGVADDPVVSADIIGDPRASVVDAAMTRVVDQTLVKVMSWYDNEWGFTCQMIREAFGLPAADLSQIRP